MRTILVVAGILILVLIALGRPSHPAGQVAVTDYSPSVRLTSNHGAVDEAGYFTIDGEVENLGARPIEHLEAVAQVYDANGALLTSNFTFVEYDPLAAGQVAPFKLIVAKNPLIRHYSVGFRLPDGQMVPQN